MKRSQRLALGLVSLSERLLRLVLRSRWRRGSNQRLRSWYVRRYFGHLTERYRRAAASAGPNAGPVWVFWWQGEEAMPPVVAKCLALARAHAPEGHPVVLLTERNYREWADIPAHIVEKVRRGVITLTHFSDILRMTLLAARGGLWMDATLYTAAPIPPRLFAQGLFTVRTPDDGQWVSRCRWTGFLMGGAAGHPLFGLVRDLFLEYWREHETLVDYFLIDVAIALAYEGLPQVRRSIDEGAWPTDLLFVPQASIALKADAARFEAMAARWPFYKMTYRDWFGPLTPRDAAGDITWYGYMLAR